MILLPSYENADGTVQLCVEQESCMYSSSEVDDPMVPPRKNRRVFKPDRSGYPTMIGCSSRPPDGIADWAPAAGPSQSGPGGRRSRSECNRWAWADSASGSHGPRAHSPQKLRQSVAGHRTRCRRLASVVRSDQYPLPHWLAVGRRLPCPRTECGPKGSIARS